jgi:hypothetical protein
LNIAPDDCKLVTSLAIWWEQALDATFQAHYDAADTRNRRALGPLYEEPKTFEFFSEFPMVKKVRVLNRESIEFPMHGSMREVLDALRKGFEKEDLEVTFEVEWTEPCF